MQKLKRTKVSLKGKREPHIFLCHSSANKDFVRKLAKDLNYFGLDGWLDEWEIDCSHCGNKDKHYSIEDLILIDYFHQVKSTNL